MRAFFTFSLSLFFFVNNSSAQLKIINNSDFNYELVFITASNMPLKTATACFAIIEKRVNKSNLNSRENMVVDYEFKKDVKYDLFLVDTSEWGTYDHTACLHSVSFDNEKTVTVINDSVPRPFFYHCLERELENNETELTLNFTNNTKYRILEFSYAIDDLNKFTTSRNLVPWAPLVAKASGKYYLTHFKKEGVEKELKLKFKLELNGVFKEKTILLKFTDEKIDFALRE
jgi:hypothetical protein